MEKDSLRVIKGILVFICILLTLAVLKICSGKLIPLVIAVFLFILVNPLLDKMEKVKIPKVLSGFLVLLLIAMILFLFVYVMVTMVNLLLAKLPEYVMKVSRFDQYVSERIRNVFSMELEEFPSILSVLNIDWFGYVKSMLSSASSLTATFIGNGAMILLYLLFMLMERATLEPKMEAAFTKGQRATDMLTNISHQTSRYLYVKVMISGATGILFYLTALISGMDFPMVWGVSAFLLNFIPTIGSIVVTVVATFMAAVQFMPNWGIVIGLFFVFMMIEMVLGNVLDPKISGVQLNLSPLVILIMLTLWGYIWGIVGMFLAVPITSVLQVVCVSIPSLKPVAIILSTGTIYNKKDEGEN
ncbi:MAG: AI-2E family transporter [Spirochaetales bacterium]|nr:AI-2E family transporter [Candidatus Physcosoma equi]